MTFVFDGRFIRTRHHDGISRFSAALIEQLHSQMRVSVLICDLRQLDQLPKGIDYIFECAPTSIQEWGLAKRLNQAGVSVLYSPMQTTSTRGAKFKVILTLHDLIYYKHRRPPAEFSLAVKALWRLYHLSFWPARNILGKADGLVTISETTKDLIRKNRLFTGPIEVVTNASDMPSPKVSPNNSQSRVLTYMGSFMPYKNVEFLIRGVANTDYELHLLSGLSEARQSDLEALAKDLDAKVVFHRGVTDAQYLEILDRSFALVSASRDEGFGIPLVEAMTRGIPVLCSDIPIFNEVAGDAGMYFDLADPTTFRQGISQLKNRWKEHSEESFSQASHYSWEKSGQRLADFIKRIAN